MIFEVLLTDSFAGRFSHVAFKKWYTRPHYIFLFFFFSPENPCNVAYKICTLSNGLQQDYIQCENHLAIFKVASESFCRLCLILKSLFFLVRVFKCWWFLAVFYQIQDGWHWHWVFPSVAAHLSGYMLLSTSLWCTSLLKNQSILWPNKEFYLQN